MIFQFVIFYFLLQFCQVAYFPKRHYDFRFFEFLSISSSTCFDHFLFPTINKIWKKQQSEMFSYLKSLKQGSYIRWWWKVWQSWILCQILVICCNGPCSKPSVRYSTHSGNTNTSLLFNNIESNTFSPMRWKVVHTWRKRDLLEPWQLYVQGSWKLVYLLQIVMQKLQNKWEKKCLELSIGMLCSKK